MMTDDRTCDRAVVAALLVPAVLLPSSAHAVQVGCFFTALFLGAMFVVCLGLTSLGKHLLVRHLAQFPRTPWLRLLGITWLELLTGIAVFAAVRTSFWTTVLIYLPLAALLNRALLGRLVQAAAVNAPAARRAGLFVLFALTLPVALQVSGILWRTLTDAITFTELR